MQHEETQTLSISSAAEEDVAAASYAHILGGLHLGPFSSNQYSFPHHAAISWTSIGCQAYARSFDTRPAHAHGLVRVEGQQSHPPQQAVPRPRSPSSWGPPRLLYWLGHFQVWVTETHSQGIGSRENIIS